MMMTLAMVEFDREGWSGFPTISTLDSPKGYTFGYRSTWAKMAGNKLDAIERFRLPKTPKGLALKD
jgi:hypothetical protein